MRGGPAKRYPQSALSISWSVMMQASSASYPIRTSPLRRGSARRGCSIAHSRKSSSARDIAAAESEGKHDVRILARDRGFADSLLEQAGFEPLVPPAWQIVRRCNGIG